MNIHEDIEREATRLYPLPQEDKQITMSATTLQSHQRLSFLTAATSERVKGMAFAEWCSVRGYGYMPNNKVWLTEYGAKPTSDLFQIFLQNEPK